jgi:hypothetical protein
VIGGGAARADTLGTDGTITGTPTKARADTLTAQVVGRGGWYRLNVTNTRAATTTGTANLTETLPRGLSSTWAYRPGWRFQRAGATGTCTHIHTDPRSTS